MNQEPVNIKEVSIELLKATGYDEVAKLEMAQQAIQMINTELSRRASEASKVVEPVEVPIEEEPKEGAQKEEK